MALTSVVGLFLLGAATGALSTHLYDAWQIHAGHGSGGHASRHIDRLAGLLDLTPDQRQQVDEILHEAHAEGRKLHEELLPRVHAHMRQVHERLIEVLTPEQRDKLAELEHFDRGFYERFMLTAPAPAHDH
jgi:Spy/CpxP family protein refolding chaperone